MTIKYGLYMPNYPTTGAYRWCNAFIGECGMWTTDINIAYKELNWMSPRHPHVTYIVKEYDEK